MKTLFTLFIAILIATNLLAQAPQKFSYQAIVRDATNTLMATKTVGIQISILKTNPNGTAVYTERHTTTTNANGIATIEIGGGTVITGTMSAINWAAGPFFIKTETDILGGTNYKISGTSELLSVPYALFSATGVKGDKGDTGEKGEKGDTGAQGPAGTGGGSSNTWTLKSLSFNNNGIATIDGTTGSGGPISSANSVWLTNGNSNSGTSTFYIGTNDNKDLNFRRNNLSAGIIGIENTAFGISALGSVTATGANSAFGAQALAKTTDGIRNTAIGYYPMYRNKTGSGNVALGYYALTNNTTGTGNTAIGSSAMVGNSTALFNTAVGYNSLYSNDNGAYNTALGASTLYASSSSFNTAIGYEVLFSSTNGTRNTAVGYRSMNATTTGVSNSSLGYNTLLNNTTGGYNLAVGFEAMFLNTKGTDNTAVGNNALYSNTIGNNNTAVGNHALNSNTSGTFNTAIGNYALTNLTTGSNNIGVGNGANVPNATGSNQIRIGDANITYAGVQVAWSITSDNRWKSDIKKSELGLDFINKLNPVSYIRLNDNNKKKEFGFIAQEVEESLESAGVSNSGIITKDDTGLYNMRYNDLLAPMIKAIQEQQATIEILKKRIETLENEKLKQ